MRAVRSFIPFEIAAARRICKASRRRSARRGPPMMISSIGAQIGSSDVDPTPSFGTDSAARTSPDIRLNVAAIMTKLLWPAPMAEPTAGLHDRRTRHPAGGKFGCSTDYVRDRRLDVTHRRLTCCIHFCRSSCALLANPGIGSPNLCGALGFKRPHGQRRPSVALRPAQRRVEPHIRQHRPVRLR